MSALTLALPSKGRLMDQAQALFAEAGLALDRAGLDRGYRGRLRNLEGIGVTFLSASEIAEALREGRIDLGITGEDLLREAIPPDDRRAEVLLRLGFGPASVVVAVPMAWLDVASMADLDEVSVGFYERHGRRLRVATKYANLTRRFFAAKGVTGYRIVESLGATEGAPAQGIAEIVVDITTSGATLAANRLKRLDDGTILDSCAVLAATAAASRDARATALAARLAAALPPITKL